MPKHPEYESVQGIVKPPHRGGRHKNISNKDRLVERALIGLKNGTYKNYGDAATKLAPKYRIFIERIANKSGGIESAIDTLRRAIGKRVREENVREA